MIVFFPHIPKAGGQTLIQGFYKAFGTKKCIKVWDPNFGADVSSDNFYKLSDKEFEGISAIVGHLPLLKFLKNNYIEKEFKKGNILIFTCVREPILRMISLYNYITYFEKHPLHEKIVKLSPVDSTFGVSH